jgi:hypothetical protein
MTASANSSQRQHVISRLLAAFIPGFILTNTLGVMFVLLLPVDRLVAISWVSVLAFLFYSALVVWIFYIKSLKTLWSLLIAGIIFSSAISSLLLLLEAT